MGKGENAGNQHFLLFPQCFLSSNNHFSIFHLYLFCCPQMLWIWTSPIFCHLVKIKAKASMVSELKRLRRKNDFYQKKHCEGRRISWHFLFFPLLYFSFYFTNRPLAHLISTLCTNKPKALICRQQIKGCFTFPKQQILDSSKLKEFADDNFKFDENGRKFSKRVENTVGKVEIAHYQQFFFFAVFSKDLHWRHIKTRAVWVGVKSWFLSDTVENFVE